MPIRAARQVLTGRGASRAGQSLGLAVLALLLGSQGLQNAVANGDTRTISLHHIHTGEDLTVTFKRNGRYDEEALKKVNHVLRDWRRDEETTMDPHLLDVVWEVYRDVDAKVPIQVVCGYRAPATNAMLRSRSRGVARFSQHMLGHAMDFFIPGVPLEAQREARACGYSAAASDIIRRPARGSSISTSARVRHWPLAARAAPSSRKSFRTAVPCTSQPMANRCQAIHSRSPTSRSAARASRRRRRWWPRAMRA